MDDFTLLHLSYLKVRRVIQFINLLYNLTLFKTDIFLDSRDAYQNVETQVLRL